MDTTQHTPADVRERVAKTVYLWEATRFGAAESWALRSWEQESNTRRELYFNVADRILSLLRTPRGEGERGLIMRAMLETFPWSPDIRQEHFERAADAVIAALRSEAPVGVLDKLRELICDVAASGVAFEDERLDYLEIQIDRQTWDEVCALAARQEGGSDG